ncbi:MAG: DNA repair protein RecN [Thermobacillus sp. ZCTH02-B1]|uniref:DNA repair protein RecN n=1 Tax=Thermobacillus sp. ZCTH02-B1 TaxID=1858795 RepID=UPI000B572A26|nr:DNA repair protein RecN [Thermobacillus sp. ZCTH02-B1]OUM96856.1 MAG: DNA repair protein RecN [Thermobacillus sp. ZCTH02-B1]
MLRELSIRNLAVIEHVTVSFAEGFHVLTGETGAGKSILIDALTLAIGGRGSADLVRYGCEKAEIEALFEPPAGHPVWDVLESFGIEADPGEPIVVRRELSVQGKSVCRVNGRIVNLSMLREIGDSLVNIHGQHEHQSLLRTERHLEWLDVYAGEPLAALKREYQEAYRRYAETRSRLRELEDASRHNMQMLDLYRFQLREIDDARLKPGEDEELQDERRRLANAERLMQNAAEAYDLIYGRSGLDALARAIARLEDIRRYDASVGPLLDQLQSAYYQAEDVAHQLRDYRDRIEADPERLAEIEDRLDLLGRLKRKYGERIEDILAYRDQIAAAVDTMENRDEHLLRLREEERKLRDEARRLALALSEQRRLAADRLAKEIEGELKELHMERTTFRVQLEQPAGEDGEPKLGPNGIDEAMFLFSANPGEPPKPLAKIASGGEMSRIMLALKTVFAAIDGVPVLVFDEVDTGVSGRAAQAIAEKLSKLSRRCQVFAITHLPQVACMADHHYGIRKSTAGERTTTTVEPLEGAGRVEELARMLGGVEVTDRTRHHAQEMLDLAARKKGA